MKLLLLIVILVFYSLACLGIGFFVFRLSSKSKIIDDLSAGTEFATNFILGQGFLASIWLLLALFRFFSLPVILGILIISCMLGLYFVKIRFLALINQLRYIWQDIRGESVFWQLVAVLTIFSCLLWASSIGRSVIGDGSAFYFALPKVIAASHQLIPLPGYETYMFIGLQGEMHFAALMALKSPEAAQLFSWPTILAGAVMLLALGRKVGLGRRGQWIALATIFTSSAVLFFSGDGKPDLFGVSFGFACYYWVMRIQPSKNQSLEPWLTGLFGGFALISKLSYIPVLVPGIFLLFCWVNREEIKKQSMWKSHLAVVFRSGAIIGLGIILAFIPQLLKNGLLVHNVIAPFGTSAINQVWYSPATIKRIIFTYPFALTFGKYWGQYGDISLLVLAFLPLSLFIPKPKSILKSPLFAVTISATVSLLIWMSMRPSELAPRYILAPLLLFILLPARAAEYVSLHETKPRLLSSTIVLAVIFSLIGIIYYYKPVIFFPKSTVLYLFDKLPECGRERTQFYGDTCPAMEAINMEAAQGDRVYLGSYYRYWLRSDLLQCLNSSTEEPTIFNKSNSSEDYWRGIYGDGFKYFIYDKSVLGDISKNQNFVNLPSWVNLVPLFQGEDVSSFRIDLENAPLQPYKECRQLNAPAWEVVSAGTMPE